MVKPIGNLGEPETFNISDDSSDEEPDSSRDVLVDTPINAVTKASPLEDTERSSCNSGARSPLSIETIAPSSTRFSDGGDTDLHVDVWMEDDWITPTRERANTSPCTAAQNLEKENREVADAVLAELQVDLQAEVQRAVNQMSSWISDEIAFARKGFEEESCKVRETLAAKHEEVDKSHSEFHVKLAELQATLDDHKAILSKLSQDNSSQLRPRALTDSQPLQPSSNVLEARRVADERKRRLELDNLQSGLDKQLQRIETLDKQFTCLTERIDSDYEACKAEDRKLCLRVDELQSGSKTQLESIEALTKQSTEKQTLAAKLAKVQATIDEHSKSIKSVEDISCDLTARAKTLDSQIKVQMEEERSKLGAKTEELSCGLEIHLQRIEVLDRRTAQLVETVSEQTVGLKQQLATEVDEIYQKLDKIQSSQYGHLERLGDLDKQTANLSERANMQSANLEACTADVCKLRLKVDECQTDFDKQKDVSRNMDKQISSLSDTIIDQGSKMEQQLAAESERLNSKLDKLQSNHGGHLVRLDAMGKRCASFMEKAEPRLSEEDNLKLKVDELQVRINGQVEQMRKMGRESACLMQRSSTWDAADAELKRMRGDLQGDSGVLKELKVTVARHESVINVNVSAIEDLRLQTSQYGAELQSAKDALQGIKSRQSASHKERLAELQVVCSKLDEHEAKLDTMPGTFRTQLRSSEESLLRTITDFNGNLQRSQAQLSEQLSTKAPLSAIQEAEAVMQNWVLEAQLAHQAAVGELTKSIEEGASAKSKLEATVQQHAEWMQQVHAWAEQTDERDRGHSHILFRIVEEDYPGLIKMFEEVIPAAH